MPKITYIYLIYIGVLILSFTFNTHHCSLHYNPLAVQIAGFITFSFVLTSFKRQQIPRVICLIVILVTAYMVYYIGTHQSLVSKNVIGMYAAMNACLALYLIDIKRWRGIAYPAVLILSAGCVMIGSRGAVTGLIIAYTVYALARWRVVGRWILPISMAILFLLPIKQINPGYYSTFGNDLNITNGVYDPSGGRVVNILPHIWPVIKRGWLFGVGIGNGYYNVPDCDKAQGPHNYFLEIITYGGIIALGLWLWIIVYALTRRVPLPLKLAIIVYIWYGWWDSQAAGTTLPLMIFNIILGMIGSSHIYEYDNQTIPLL
jgi:hypothetical protein